MFYQPRMMSEQAGFDGSLASLMPSSFGGFQPPGLQTQPLGKPVHTGGLPLPRDRMGSLASLMPQQAFRSGYMPPRLY